MTASVYVAGPKGSLKKNQWEIMTNDKEIALKYPEWKQCELKPPRRRRKKK